MEEKETNIKKIFKIIKRIFNKGNFYIWILILLFAYNFIGNVNPNKEVEKSLKNSCVENLSNEEGNEYAQEYRMIMELMFSSKKSMFAFSKENSGFKYIDKNTDYEIVGEKEIEVPHKYANIDGREQMGYTYVKLKIKVSAPNYALAYKNAVDETNKYIKENKEATKEEIQKYFANRLRSEGEKAVNRVKVVNYIYKAQDSTSSAVSGQLFVNTEYYAGLLPDQKNNLDLVNAMLGGLVEEMKRTKLPEGVDLEDTLQLMGIE